MSEDKKALLQKVLDLKLKKSEVEKAIGLPTNSLSAMCKGKKDLPDKYVEKLRLYLSQPSSDNGKLKFPSGNNFLAKTLRGLSGELANNLEFKVLPGPVTTAIIPYNEKPDLDENGLPKSLSLTFDCEKIPNSLIDEFPKWDQKGADELMKLCSFLKSEGITPEQLIEGYKKSKEPKTISQEDKDKIIETLKKDWQRDIKVPDLTPNMDLHTQPVPISTNTPQGLSQAALDIRKKKLGY